MEVRRYLSFLIQWLRCVCSGGFFLGALFEYFSSSIFQGWVLSDGGEGGKAVMQESRVPNKKTQKTQKNQKTHKNPPHYILLLGRGV